MDLSHTWTGTFHTAASALGPGAEEHACEPCGAEVSTNTGHRLVAARGRGMWRGGVSVGLVGANYYI